MVGRSSASLNNALVGVVVVRLTNAISVGNPLRNLLLPSDRTASPYLCVLTRINAPNGNLLLELGAAPCSIGRGRSSYQLGPLSLVALFLTPKAMMAAIRVMIGVAHSAFSADCLCVEGLEATIKTFETRRFNFCQSPRQLCRARQSY